MTTTRTQARIEADERVPMIHIYRDFAATPAQLFRAHTDPSSSPGGSARRTSGATSTTGTRATAARGATRPAASDFETAFRGCFHTVARSGSCRPSRGRASPTASPSRR